MGRGFSVVLVLVLALSAVSGVGFVTGTTPLNAAVTDVSISPDPVVPGERLTAEVTIENFASSSEAYRIKAVAVRSAAGDLDELSRVEDPGVVTPGGSLTVPFSLRFDNPGSKQFRVVVFGEGQQTEDDLQLTYPLRVTVTDAKPKVEIDLRRPVAGVSSNATVTFANGVDRELRNVEVRLDGDVTVERPRRIQSALGAGETTEFTFEVTPETAGETELDATVEYTLAGGPTRTVRASTTVQTRALADRVDLRSNVSDGRILVTATNLGNVDVERLVVGGDGDGATVGERVLSTLATGESRTVALPVETFTASDGTANVTVSGAYDVGDQRRALDGGQVTLRRELVLNASVRPDGVSVTVTNRGDVAAERVAVGATGDGAALGERAVGTVDPGEQRQVVLPVEALGATETTVDVRATYGDRSQYEATGTRVELSRGVTLNATATDGAVTVQVANLGAVGVERVVVRGSATDATVGQAVVPALAPGESTTVTLPVSGLRRSADVAVTGRYAVGSTTADATGDSVTLERVPGRIELTGIDFQSEDGTLTISGSVSNVGLESVDSVVVRVVPTDGVTPVAPNREYFVGSVPASDFVSFDVTARVDTDVSSVPLNVSYLADGERRSELLTVPLDTAATTPSAGDGGSGGGLLLPALGGVLVVLVVGAFVLVGWRNRRGGD